MKMADGINAPILQLQKLQAEQILLTDTIAYFTNTRQ
jgi:hypothetical protein